MIVIRKAKYILWTECELTLHDVLKLEKIRRWDTSSHTQAEADLEDVMDAMEKLDRQHALSKVCCEADNLLQLPLSIPALSVGVEISNLSEKTENLQREVSRGLMELENSMKSVTKRPLHRKMTRLAHLLLSIQSREP